MYKPVNNAYDAKIAALNFSLCSVSSSNCLIKEVVIFIALKALDFKYREYEQIVMLPGFRWAGMPTEAVPWLVSHKPLGTLLQFEMNTILPSPQQDLLFGDCRFQFFLISTVIRTATLSLCKSPPVHHLHNVLLNIPC